MSALYKPSAEHMRCNEPDPLGRAMKCTRPKMHEGACSWTVGRCNDEGPNGMRCQREPGHGGVHTWRRDTQQSTAFQWENTSDLRAVPKRLDLKKIAQRVGGMNLGPSSNPIPILMSTKPEGGLFYFYDGRTQERASPKGLTVQELDQCLSDEPVKTRPGAYDPLDEIKQTAAKEVEWLTKLEERLAKDHEATVLVSQSAERGYTITTASGTGAHLDLKAIENVRARLGITEDAIIELSFKVAGLLDKMRVETPKARFDQDDEDFRERRAARRNKLAP